MLLIPNSERGNNANGIYPSTHSSQSYFTHSVSFCFSEEGANIYCGSTKLNSVPQNVHVGSHIILTYSFLRYFTSHFTDVESEAQRSGNLFKAISL